ncbi:dual specificity protein phosphatase 12-like [Oppia nitens]|uniref:dual specificity protein phosphatase 12-like n=1 Tax=Oppia nitens TaxID=1686743 RepID=UPI0023DA27F3|nr:dual specificity protein phosphatase 12-like [Oppia nitens]
MSKIRQRLLLMPIDCDESDFAAIERHLFLGNKELAHNPYHLKKLDITLVIGVYPKSQIDLIVQLMPSQTRFRLVDAKDIPHEDLISRFDSIIEDMIEEIEDKEGNVFVFCSAGFSRSVTVVAAYLMKKLRITANEAIERIRTVRPKINPNPGFIGQLALYEDMDYEFDVRHPEYRVFALICLKKQIWTQDYWEESEIGEQYRHFCIPLSDYQSKLKSNDKNSRISLTNIHYNCVNCCQSLFNELNVLKPTLDFNVMETNDCPNLFIEPQEWMKPMICIHKKGRLLCPKCDTLLGSFKWKSYKCQCLKHNQLHDSLVFKIITQSVIAQ